MNHTSSEAQQPALHLVQEPQADESPPQAEIRQARLEFAEALGRYALARDTSLFDRALVGRWASMEHLLDNFIAESGIADSLEQVPARLQNFITVDRFRVMQELRRDLLVIGVGEAVWVFDSPGVVNSTVAKTERSAHSEVHDE